MVGCLVLLAGEVWSKFRALLRSTVDRATLCELRFVIEEREDYLIHQPGFLLPCPSGGSHCGIGWLDLGVNLKKNF